MLGFLKKKEPVEKQPELLEKKNIRLGYSAMEKKDVIRQVGRILCDSGYVKEDYIEAMIKREESFPTNIGNGIALPHGIEEAKKEILRSGIAVMVFPEGTDWGGEDVKLVIGIAGVGEEHLEILSIIAEKMSEPDAVERLITGDVEMIYRTFTEKGEKS